MAKYKPSTVTITDEKALNALMSCMREKILQWEEEIVDRRRAIIRDEETIRKIKAEGKHTQTFPKD